MESPLPSLVPKNYLGYISADLPWVVTLGEEFEVDVFLVAATSAPHKPVTIYMERTDRIRYEPRALTISPGERVTVKTKIVRSPGGLSEIFASADGWYPLQATVSTGFRGNLSVRLPASLDSGSVSSFSVQFIDEIGGLISLDSPASLVVEVTSAEIRHGSKPWSQVLKLPLDPGANSSPVLELKPTDWKPSRGTLRAELRINSQRVIASKVVEFSCVPSGWVTLLMAAVGGTLWSLYSIARDYKKIAMVTRRKAVTQVAVTMIAGFFAGCLAYLLASWDVLGIRVDTTSLKGFIVLGFLFSYVGVESLMKGVSSKFSQSY
ncbi:MAG TPA: hypothetical protein VHQ90_13735 [Thermoanaerobaculia bacterium]|nr:hypothetical protein [Thermoanaerobaculia bacterium]